MGYLNDCEQESLVSSENDYLWTPYAPVQYTIPEGKEGSGIRKGLLKDVIQIAHAESPGGADCELMDAIRKELIVIISGVGTRKLPPQEILLGSGILLPDFPHRHPLDKKNGELVETEDIQLTLLGTRRGIIRQSFTYWIPDAVIIPLLFNSYCTLIDKHPSLSPKGYERPSLLVNQMEPSSEKESFLSWANCLDSRSPIQKTLTYFMEYVRAQYKRVCERVMDNLTLYADLDQLFFDVLNNPESLNARIIHAWSANEIVIFNSFVPHGRIPIAYDPELKGGLLYGIRHFNARNYGRNSA
ncbi:MAG: hypothetical protein Q8O95_01765 [bacterium]|nr:hypothetical protein [bacterium]